MILITGASSGIGAACAKIFAAHKRELFLVARRQTRLKSIQTKLSRTYGIDVHIAELDVSSRTAVEKFVKTHKKLLARTSVLVNNAGLAKGISLFQDGELADWEEMINTNVKGLLYMTRALLPIFIKKSDGHIVNMGSVAGHWTYPKGNVYCATKTAVRALTETLRLDLSGTKVRVTEISPGMVETEFSVVRLGDQKKADAIYAGMTPLTAEDIAETVAWCVERPKHVNIQEVVIYPTDQASPTVVHRT